MINFLRISNRIKLGDYLHLNGDINDIASKDIIGVCVIPSNFLPDKKARFVSMAAMNPLDKGKGNYTKESKMVWYSDEDYCCDFLVQRDRVPLDTKSEGIINGNAAWGRIPLLDSFNSNLTIANPQDPGTKYYDGTTCKIPSPYALDGSFNPNFHYRGSEYDEWALTDYRGDLNTRDVVYSEEPGEEICPAFYCCNEFSPGYRDHEWYLPAVGELAFIPPRLEIIRNKMQEAVDAGSLGVVLLSTKIGSAYWSSSEHDSMLAWYVSLKFGSVNYTEKDSNCYVRAFLAI